MCILTPSDKSSVIIAMMILEKDNSSSGSVVGGNVTIEGNGRSWLNSSDVLPPVGCPLLIELSHILVPATRTGFIKSKSAEMEYRLANGCLIHGRYRWTYP